MKRRMEQKSKNAISISIIWIVLLIKCIGEYKCEEEYNNND